MKTISLLLILSFLMIKLNAQNLQYIPKIIDTTSQSFKDEYNAYISALKSNPTSEAEIYQIFQQRDSLMTDIDKIFNTYYYAMTQQQFQTWEDIDKELKSIGFKVIYAEGTYIGLDVAPILETRIKKYASKPFQYYADFRNKRAVAMGGEYPYANNYDAFVAVYAAEKLYKDYPQSQYLSLIDEQYRELLFTITDVHYATTSNDGVKGCYYNAFHYDFYPYYSNCSDIEKIIKDFPNSMYINVFKELNENMSAIFVQLNKPKELVVAYVIVTEKVDNETAGINKVFDYLNNGVSIVHNIAVDDGTVTDYYVAYRYFSNKSKAEEALNKIKPIAPKAKIIEVVLTDPYSNVQMRNNMRN